MTMCLYSSILKYTPRTMNIRLRLSLLFSLTTTIIVIALLTVIYYTVSVGRQQAYFTQMETRALAVADVFFFQNTFDSLQLAQARKTFRSSFALSVAAIIDSKNHLASILNQDSTRHFTLQSNTPLSSAPFTIDAKSLLTARLEGKCRRLSEQNEGTFYEVYLLHPAVTNNYIIVVRGMDRPGSEMLASLRLVLFVGGCLFPFIAFGVGWLFVGTSFRPMQRITEAAKKISASNLSRRLPEAEGNDEIATLAQTFNGVFGQLEAAFEGHKRFIAHASHELRTPLTILEGEVSVALQRLRTPEEYAQTLETMQRTILRLHHLTTNLLTLSQLESGASNIPMAEEFVDEVLYHTLADTQMRYPHRTFHIQDEFLQGQDVRVFCNRLLLETAFANIFENAVKYSNSDTPISISTTLTETTFELIVQDEGLGINEEELQHLFKPFYRSERTGTIKGTGVGLALVNAIMRLHRGTVQIASIIDKGTDVRLILPLRK